MTSLLLIPILVYLGIVILTWFVSDKLIFQPQPSSYKDDASVTRLKTSSGEIISAKFYENPSAAYTVLFSHGNAEDMGDIELFIHYLRDSGFSVLTYDYRGYGTSEGAPSENKTYCDISAAYGYLTDIRKVQPDKIILHGRSLGGGPSVDLASRQPVGGLIMESTFTSASRVLTKIKLIPFDRFANINKIVNVKCPVLIIHGKEDWTIPFHHGEALFAAAPGPKYSFWVDNAGHNDLFDTARDSYIEAVRSFAATLENPGK